MFHFELRNDHCFPAYRNYFLLIIKQIRKPKFILNFFFHKSGQERNISWALSLFPSFSPWLGIAENQVSCLKRKLLNALRMIFFKAYLKVF